LAKLLVETPYIKFQTNEMKHGNGGMDRQVLALILFFNSPLTSLWVPLT